MSLYLERLYSGSKIVIEVRRHSMHYSLSAEAKEQAYHLAGYPRYLQDNASLWAVYNLAYPVKLSFLRVCSLALCLQHWTREGEQLSKLARHGIPTC
jgi:hypothetical protein